MASILFQPTSQQPQGYCHVYDNRCRVTGSTARLLVQRYGNRSPTVDQDSQLKTPDGGISLNHLKLRTAPHSSGLVAME
jgi:hypothetical protein